VSKATKSPAQAQLPLGAVLPPTPAARPEPRVYGVGEVVRSARLVLESRFADVRVEGEISGLRPSAAGHLYFVLKDQDAQIDCALFAREASRLRFRPKDGLQVQCRGRLTIYEGRGRFQMSVTSLQPAGAGALALAFEALKKQLQSEGLFDDSRKRPLPFLPRRVGVVTSEQGAVIRDIINVAHRRYPLQLLVAPAPVQGDAAAPALVSALKRLAAVPDVDVIILARGGGSMEDLWPFNEEILARAVAECPTPVVSAVGHQTDFTIADFVADRRAPTPSAAAEIVVPEWRSLRHDLSTLRTCMGRALENRLKRARHDLGIARLRLSDPRPLIGQRRQTLDELSTFMTRALERKVGADRSRLQRLEKQLLQAHPLRRIAEQRRTLDALESRLKAAGQAATAHRRQALQGLVAKLEALSPLGVLQRGYSLVRSAEGRVIASVSQVEPGDALRIAVADGAFAARVADSPPEQRHAPAGDAQVSPQPSQLSQLSSPSEASPPTHDHPDQEPSISEEAP